MNLLQYNKGRSERPCHLHTHTHLNRSVNRSISSMVKVAVAGAGGSLGMLLFGMLQRLAQEENLTGVGMPIGVVGTADGARALSKGLYRQFGMAFAPETAVRFVDMSNPLSWQNAYMGCEVAIVGGSFGIEKKRLPPKFMRSLSMIPLHECEFTLDSERSQTDGNEEKTVLTAQLEGAVAAGVKKILVACPSAGAAQLDALESCVSAAVAAQACSLLVTTPAGLVDTEGWTYLDMPDELLHNAEIDSWDGTDVSVCDGETPTPSEEYARLLVRLAVAQEEEEEEEVSLEVEQAKANKASGHVPIRPLRATARHGRAGEPSLSLRNGLRNGVSRRLALSTLLSGTAWISNGGPNSAAFAADIRFESDDLSFGFELPPQWVPATAPEEERASGGHLISVRAQKLDGAASLQAIVDGGSRGRRYGSSLRDLGSLEMVAQRLVQEELLNDSGADFASVISSEQTGGLGSTSYYVVRYQVGGKPVIAKLAVAQQRLYCIKIRAKEEEKAGFFERAGGKLLSDMEAIAQSFGVVAVNYPCLESSNAGKVPDEDVCKVLRP